MQMEMNTRYLPSELIIEILLRLPVKSLICFKCVCKLWFSLISHPNFANSHFQSTSTRRILIMSHQYPSVKFQCIDVEINRDSTIRNHDFLLPRPYRIKGSCRGFLFLHSIVDIWIWNPSSRVHKQIPLSYFDWKLGSSLGPHLYGFGYDHSRDDYLIVILTYDHFANRSSHLEFFSLRDNMWNEIGGTRFTYLSIANNLTCGSFVNGAIHWLPLAAKNFDLPLEIIVAFDLIERKLFEMPLPDEFHHREYYSLWVFGEFLGLNVMDYKNHTVEIWIMKEYKQHSSWTKTIVIHDDCWNIPFFKLICHTKSGDIIGKDDGRQRLVKYNGKGQLLEYLEINQHGKEFAMYTESLFSLPSDR